MSVATHGSGVNKDQQVAGNLAVGGTVTVGSAVILRDGAGHILMATGLTVPGAVAGYAKGALFIDTDVATGTTGLYVNVGTTAASSFKAVTNAS